MLTITKEKYVKKTLIILIFMASYLTGVTTHASISIKAPSEAELSQIVPINIKLSNSIKQGDTLNVYINNNLAYAIQPSGGASVSYFSGRVRALNWNSTVRAEIIKNGIISEEANSSFSSTQGLAEIPSNSDSNKRYKEKFKKNYLRVSFRNKMGDSGFIDNIDINTSEGDIKIQLTPYASGCCTSFTHNGKTHKAGGFIGIKGNFDKANVTSINLNK